MCTSAGHFFLLLLGASCAAAAPVHTRTQTGLEHEDVTLDGWVLDEVFVYHPHEDPSSDLLTLTRRKLSFNNNPHLAPESRRRRLANTDGDSFTPTNIRAELSAVDASGDLTRAKVRGLAKINFANQDLDWRYFAWGTSTNPIAEAGEMFYTENKTQKLDGKTYLPIQ